jgi:hypothetical protein
LSSAWCEIIHKLFLQRSVSSFSRYVISDITKKIVL